MFRSVLRRFRRPLLFVATIGTFVWLGAGAAHAAGLAAPHAMRMLQETLALPGWLVGAAPALAYALNWAILKAGGDTWAEGQKKNVVFSVNAAIFAGLILTGQIAPPAGRPSDGLISNWLVYAGAWFAYVHKGSNAIADIMSAGSALLGRA